FGHDEHPSTRKDQILTGKVSIKPSAVPADYFAGCLLVPKKLLKRAYYGGMQRPADLAAYFQVSEAAMTVRLRQTGIVEPAPRCTPQSTPFSRSWQYRMN
ncbi:ImmA/IrrE family metallo-endopeptidase, partial [Burkholderia sp. SIMBA_013]